MEISISIHIIINYDILLNHKRMIIRTSFLNIKAKKKFHPTFLLHHISSHRAIIWKQEAFAVFVVFAIMQSAETIFLMMKWNWKWNLSLTFKNELKYAQTIFSFGSQHFLIYDSWRIVKSFHVISPPFQ